MEAIICRGVEDHLSKSPTKTQEQNKYLWTYKSRKAKSQKGKELWALSMLMSTTTP